MTPHRTVQSRRRGSVAAETGIVLPIFLMMVLGIFEYSRFVMVRNLVDHAAREGARTAVVHTYDQTTAQIQSLVKSKLGGQDGQLSSLNIQVFKANPTDGTYSDVWTNARFGDCILVQVTGNFTPSVPKMLLMSSTIPIKAQVMMRCEAN